MPAFFCFAISETPYQYYTFSLPRLQCFVAMRMRLARAFFRENLRMSAHLGALCLLAAMSFIFFPSGFLEPMVITRYVDTNA
jgi:hypothetical protein